VTASRADVHRIFADLPGDEAVARLTPRPKYVVVLNDDQVAGNANRRAVVVASSERVAERRRFEVSCGTDDGFDHETVIDCRWPLTIETSQLTPENYCFTLSEAKMFQIQKALVAGLQMQPRPS
jgi:hypothetical protein